MSSSPRSTRQGNTGSRRRTRSQQTGRLLEPGIETTPVKDAGDGTRSNEEARVRSVIRVAKSTGLLKDKDSRITGRVSADLVKEAKARTGIESDTDLIEYALANVAIEDGFVEAFQSTKATVPREIDLEF